ncbi:MAG: aspartyl protease family protein, partial [Pyrinomonadaceae bacterium]
MTVIISAASLANAALIFIGHNFVATNNVAQLPESIHLSEVEGIGLVAKVRVNGAGSYKFAVDTGSGANLISPVVARAANIPYSNNTNRNESLIISGLSDGSHRIGQKVLIKSLALGGDGNQFSVYNVNAIVTDGLPADIDGVIDPIIVFGQHGVTIDFPNQTLEVFDPILRPLRIDEQPSGGTVVEWLPDEDKRMNKPFVMLDNGRKAL